MNIETNRHLLAGSVALLHASNGAILAVGKTQGEAYRNLIKCVVREAVKNSSLSEREALDAVRSVFP